jgi:FtsP/CotA-like multicopper oxidase with cupredoxin domain
MHLYHCHTTPLKKHIHKGLYGAFIIDPEGAAPAGEGARDGDERLRHGRRRRQQLLHRQRAHVLLRQVPDHGEAAPRRCGSTSPT